MKRASEAIKKATKEIFKDNFNSLVAAIFSDSIGICNRVFNVKIRKSLGPRVVAETGWERPRDQRHI